MLTETALDVPALMTKDPRQALPEGSPARRLWPPPPGVAAVQGNRGRDAGREPAWTARPEALPPRKPSRGPLPAHLPRERVVLRIRPVTAAFHQNAKTVF
jgi:hypothetical protein